MAPLNPECEVGKSHGVSPGGVVLRAVAVILTVIVVTVFILLTVRPNADEPLTSPETAAEFRTASSADTGSDGYVGVEACRDCHLQRVEQFVGTHHFRTSRRPDPEELRSILETAGPHYVSRNPNCRFSITEDEGGFAVTATTVTESGERSQKEYVALLYGAGTSDVIFHYWSGSRLFELPIAWLSSAGEWINAPGYHDGSADFGRETTARCLECHNTWFEYAAVSSDVHHRPQLIPGVSCERCHGPAERHVAHHHAHPEATAAMFITNPGLLLRELQLDLCSQCHSNTQHRRTAPFSYQPGMKLEDHFRLDQGTYPEKDHTASQLKYLRESKCFQSAGEMTCTTCHNPHITSTGSTEIAVTACYGCHQSEHCAERERLPAPVQDQCIGCHMPRSATMNLWYSTAAEDFLPLAHRHNHHIGIHPQATKAVLLDWYRRQSDALSLSTAQELSAELAELELSRARQLRTSFRWTAAVGAYRASLAFQPSESIRSEMDELVDQMLELENLQHIAAQQLREMNLAAAVKTLTGMLERKPDEAMVRGKLGLALAASGQTDEAIRELNVVSQYDPDLSYGDALLGWIHYLENRPLDSVRHYQLAVDRTPWNAKLQYQYALTLIRLGRFNEAAERLRFALEIEPDNKSARDELNRLRVPSTEFPEN